jgi:hypothetical protein
MYFTWALVVFVLAAIGGLTLAAIHFSGKNPPKRLADGHGLVALTGLVLLGLSLSDARTPGIAGSCLALFVISGTGGVVMRIMTGRGRRLPTPLVLAHGALNAVSLSLLLYAYFTGESPTVTP